MLNISSQSWHYRIRAEFFDAEPKDLCSYFWSVIGSAFAFVVFCIATGIAEVFRPVGRINFRRLKPAAPYVTVIMTALLLALLIGVITYEIWTNAYDFLIGFLQVTGVVVALALGLTLIVIAGFGVKEMHTRFRRKHPREPRTIAITRPVQPAEPKGDSSFMLIWNFLKAKKRKACPLLTVDGSMARERGGISRKS